MLLLILLTAINILFNYDTSLSKESLQTSLLLLKTTWIDGKKIGLEILSIL